MGSACVEIFLRKHDSTPVLIFAIVSGVRFWVCAGAATTFFIEDRIAVRAMRLEQMKESENQPAVTPVAERVREHSFFFFLLNRVMNH